MPTNITPGEYAKTERIIYMLEMLHSAGYFTKEQILKRFGISEPTFKKDLAFIRNRLDNRYKNPHNNEESVVFDKHNNRYLLTERFNAIKAVDEKILYLYAFLKNLLENNHYLPFYFLNELLENLKLLLKSRPDLELDNLENRIIFLFSEYETTDDEKMKIIVKALAKQQTLSLEYLAADGKISQRIVEPLSIVNHQSHWYLLTFCRKAQDFRLFLHSRIKKVTVPNEKIKDPIDQIEIDEFLKDSFGIFRDYSNTVAVVRFYGRLINEVRNLIWHPEQVTVYNKNCSTPYLEITFPVGKNSLELVSRVLRYGSLCELIEPENLRNAWLVEIKQMAEKYRT